MKLVKSAAVPSMLLACAVVLSGCDAASSMFNSSPTPTASPTGPVIVDLNTPSPGSVATAGATASIIIDGELAWSDQKDSHGCLTTATDISGKRRTGVVWNISMKATNQSTKSLQPWLLIHTGGMPTPSTAKGSALPGIKLRDGFTGVQGPVLAPGASATLSVTLILQPEAANVSRMPAWTLYGGQGTKEELLAAYDTKQISSVVTGFVLAIKC